MYGTELSEENRNILNGLKPEKRKQILFSMLYLGNKPIFFSDIAPLYNVSNEEEFINKVIPVIEELNNDLRARLAPYHIVYNEEDQTLWLKLLEEILEKLRHSELLFPVSLRKISRDKMKVLALIAFKTIIQHGSISMDEIVKRIGTSGINIINELEENGFIYQTHSRTKDGTNKGKIVYYGLSNSFYDFMGFPQEPFELSKALREQILAFLEEVDLDE